MRLNAYHLQSVREGVQSSNSCDIVAFCKSNGRHNPFLDKPISQGPHSILPRPAGTPFLRAQKTAEAEEMLDSLVIM